MSQTTTERYERKLMTFSMKTVSIKLVWERYITMVQMFSAGRRNHGICTWLSRQLKSRQVEHGDHIKFSAEF